MRQQSAQYHDCRSGTGCDTLLGYSPKVRYPCTLAGESSSIDHLVKEILSRIKAKVKNTSDFILLNGDMNIYVDGTFNSRSTLSTTNPQETFNISLG